MREKAGARAAWWLVMILVAAGCATKVERIQPEEVRDLSGRWNDTDSQLVSEAMIEDVLSRAWLQEFQRRQGQRPAVIVGEIRNRTDEHINMETFVHDMERALINSGKVIFVASREEREGIREERKDQDLHAREDTRKAMGRELGADFMLQGTISSINDIEDNREVRFYQVDLTLISLADNRKVWVGQKKIKKFITRASLRP